MATILIIEDEENLRFSIRQTLARAGHQVAEAEAVTIAWELTRRDEFDVILTDINLRGENGLDLVKRLREDGYAGAIVVMTAYGSVESAVNAMRLGADDYLQKPVSLEELSLLVDRLIEQRKVRRRLKLYERMESVRGDALGVIGESPAWRKTLELAERLSSMPLPPPGQRPGRTAGGALPTVLILGETGTGKGLLARHIHTCAHNRAGGSEAPFVHINCSALPATLIEAELFGHEKGAFTDAKTAREGLFEMAEGGTIFLDEIGDMPLELQTKILTVVEEGTYRRVGGTRERTVRARLIAATNQDLEARVAEGKFRRDLYYRLNAFTLSIPPLRHRREDAILIARSMLERFARDFGRPVPTLSDSAREAIAAHPWPGNVREIINVMQRVAMLCDGPEVSAADLALPGPAMPGAHGSAAGRAGALEFDFERGIHKFEDVEKELLVQALRHTRGNVSQAAKLIGMQRSSFRYRIDQYHLHEFVQELVRR